MREVETNLPGSPWRRFVRHLRSFGTVNWTCDGRVRDPRFFVVGCPRSSTTLLAILLGRHPRLCVAPETAFYDEVAPALERAQNDEAAMLSILREWRRMAEFGIEPEDVLGVLTPDDRSPGRILAALLHCFAKRHGKAGYGEKTPQHLLHVPRILRDFPEARILCVQRDGRDVALSLNAMPWWKPRDLAAAAELWKQSVETTETLVSRYPRQISVVRYEELVADPEKVLSSLLSDLGETFHPSQLQPETHSAVVLPRSMPWKETALARVDQHHAQKRRNEASAEDRAYLDQTLHGHLSRLGYDVTEKPHETSGE